jgi:hypothetical protein
MEFHGLKETIKRSEDFFQIKPIKAPFYYCYGKVEMSHILVIENDFPGIFAYVYQENEIYAGSSLSNFLLALSTFCNSDESVLPEISELEWFRPIAASIPELCLLADVWYEGDWNYSENDYEKFLSESPHFHLSKMEFIETLIQINKKWKDIYKIQKVIDCLLNIFELTKYPETWFYAVHETEKDLFALNNSIKQAISRGVRRIRFKFC